MKIKALLVLRAFFKNCSPYTFHKSLPNSALLLLGLWHGLKLKRQFFNWDPIRLLARLAFLLSSTRNFGILLNLISSTLCKIFSTQVLFSNLLITLTLLLSLKSPTQRRLIILGRHGKMGQNFLTRFKKYSTRTRFVWPEAKTDWFVTWLKFFAGQLTRLDPNLNHFFKTFFWVKKNIKIKKILV